MELKQKSIPRKLATTTLATVLALSLALIAAPVAPLDTAKTAWADEIEVPDNVMPNLPEYQAKVDEAAAVYDDTSKRIAAIETQITQTNDRIAEITEKIPAARKRSGDAAAEYYRLMTSSNLLLDVIFSASSMWDFFANFEYTLRLNQGYLNDIRLLSDLSTELETENAKLEDNKKAVEVEKLHAEEALVDAQRAKEAAEEVAHRIAEQTAAATAAAAAAAAADNAAAQPAIPPVANAPTGGSGAALTGNNQDIDKQVFVNEWSGRIEAYLNGSPLAGNGWVFANAAWDYNVDPRWSPAISCIESSKGRYCFRSHNAWGWGQIDWPDWETAIYAHVKGLSHGYGYTISLANAQKYCPPNAQHWFDTVSHEMTLI